MQTPWRTMREAAEYLRFGVREANPETVARFLRSKGVKLKRRGSKTLLVHIDDLDATLVDAE